MREDWIECTVDDVIELMKNGSSSKQFNEKVGYPITRIETIWNEAIDLQRVKYIKENDQELIEKHGLRFGDILLSHINSDSHLGKTAIFKNQTKILIHGINLLLLRPYEQLNQDFINYQFKFLRAKGKFVDEAQRSFNKFIPCIRIFV
jgi:type I restriction enzyme S subunit